MNDDLISRQAVIEELHQYFSVGFDSDRYWNSTHVLQAIANVPSVEPKENGMKYCPHCGAKMEGETE